MRSSPLLAGLALTALFGLTAAASAEEYDAAVAVETDARSGHGDGPMFYATNHLHPGDHVRVVTEKDGGWLAILPPQGSFSWINKQALEHHKDWPATYWTVNADEAHVRIGSNVVAVPPSVVGVTLKRGAFVVAIPNGKEHADQEGVWLPIEPPHDTPDTTEVRYIPADAIQKPAAAVPATVVSLQAGSPAPGQDADSLYKRAIEAERWNPQESIALYNQGAAVDANADRRIQALNRANWLRDNLRNPTPTLIAGPTPGADVRTANTPSVSKVYPLTPDPATILPAVRLSPPQGAAPSTTNSFSATPTASWGGATPALAPAAPANGGSYSSGPGWLQTSGQRPLEGRKMYVLLSDRGAPFYYVTAEPGVNLDPYLKHRIECFGQAIYAKELRINYMRVARVEMREGQ